MLVYNYDANMIHIIETKDDQENTFRIKVLDTQYLKKLLAVLDYFDRNNIYTDVLSYPYKDNEFKVIVRKEFYNDFLAELLKAGLLQSLKWEDPSL
ncbi:hypothetical protein DCC85_02910 [Paenibacillus sp. CAA11]|uniref:hypothetical protein n=1 Tax=Paenibacillus sp. CAA11 TaxID=1532905 RepID=UPI000D361D59|nr:hypothetical protein [Paenibacillus sp. CAA11]AWB43281.1 hypothetical protein DCC85_02910 [Paenibacillus sp. CAA11]